MKLLIKNGTILNDQGTQESKDILLQDGVVLKIGEDVVAGDEVETIDAAGKLILPGLVDMSCDICEPGYEQREDILSASKSAAKGGFTSIACLPGTNPSIDNKAVVNYILTQSRQVSLVHIYPYGSMTKGCQGTEIAEIGEMKKAGIVALSDGHAAIADSALLRNILIYTKMFDIPVITMCEDAKLAGDGVINKGMVSTKIGLKGIPREAEEIMVARNIILAEHSRARLHITHVSTKGSVKLIRDAKKNGVDVTCDTCPHYFTLTENAVEQHTTFVKVKPPLRTQEDVESIREGLADGTIDVISSGHSPQTIESKKIEFDRASYGISMLEMAFLISYHTLVRGKVLSLHRLIELMAGSPGKILGLEGKGALKENWDGDLFIFDEDENTEIIASQFASKSKFSPYNGMKLKGRILCTLVNGNTVYVQ